MLLTELETRGLLNDKTRQQAISLYSELEMTMRRIQEDPKIYQHLFVSGQFWVNTRVATILVHLDMIELVVLFISLERWSLMNAAVNHRRLYRQ